MPAQIFISYSHSDALFATKLARDLEKAGYEVWFDRTDIQTGSRWDDEIVKGLDASTIFLVLLSGTSVASQNVKDEIGYALDHNKQILPLLIEPCEVPFRLRRVQYVDFTAMKFGEGMQTVLKIIKSFSAKGEKATDVKLAASTDTIKPAAEPKSREEKKVAPKKNTSSRSTTGDKITISITGNSNVAAVGRGAQAFVQQGSGSSELERWRKEMEGKINALRDLPPEDKSTLNQQVGQIAREAEKGPEADPRRIERLLNTIAVMAPDIFDVAVTTVINPLAGIGLVVKKIGEQAKVQKR